jgi:hypothetical protein
MATDPAAAAGEARYRKLLQRNANLDGTADGGFQGKSDLSRASATVTRQAAKQLMAETNECQNSTMRLS